MNTNERANIATDANFAKKLDDRVLEVQLGDKKVKGEYDPNYKHHHHHTCYSSI